MTDPTDKNEDKSEEGFFMAGFSGATGVPLKQMQDAIAQSTAAFAGTNKNWYNNVDLNTFTVSGYYPMGTPLTNAPATWGILTVIAVRNDTIEQIFYASSNHIYRRECRVPSSGTKPVWSAWSELATVDYVAQSTAFEATTVSGTTTADGLLKLDMTTWQHVIVELYSRSHICLLYADDYGQYFAKVLDYNLAKLASTSVSVGVRYKTVM